MNADYTLLGKYITGEDLTSEEMARLSAWRALDGENDQFFMRCLKLRIAKNYEQFNDKEAVERSLIDMHKRFSKSETKSHFRYKKIAHYLSPVAAILILVVGFLFFEKQQSDPYIVNQYIMGQGSKGSVTLPDGSVVFLNSNTKLIYAEADFKNASRKVSVEGEAYFNVVRNEKQPFVVNLKGMDITVLGTTFDVRNYPYEKNIETVLCTGSIQINTQNGEKYLLKPNERFILDSSTMQSEITDVKSNQYTTWINNDIVFENEIFTDILLQMERWYGVKIICDKDFSDQLKFSLTLQHQTKEEIMEGFRLIAPIRYNIVGNEIRIQKQVSPAIK